MSFNCLDFCFQISISLSSVAVLFHQICRAHHHIAPISFLQTLKLGIVTHSGINLGAKELVFAPKLLLGQLCAGGGGKAMFYGTVVWDPWLIVAQIVFLQCLYYLTAGIFLTVLVGFRVSTISLVYFFDYATFTVSTITGWCVVASFLLTAVAGAGYMFYVVERSKKCPDFAATVYIVHLIICYIYGGWPSSVTWWVGNVAGLAIMELLAEHLCRKRENLEIPISRYRPNVTDKKKNAQQARKGQPMEF